MKSENVPERHIGVDVSKAKLDIYVPAAKDGLAPTTAVFGNDLEGFRKLRELARKNKAVVCVEPTGGYELELIGFMLKFGVKVAYADALRVREFARAEGGLSKNDKLDAALISRFADKIGVRILEARDTAAVELRRRVKFRKTILDMRTALSHMLDTESDKDVTRMIKEQIRNLNKLIRKIEKECHDIIVKDPEKDALRARFTKVGGVGDTTAIAILAGLPEIGTLSDAKLNRLAGISPEEHQSGTKDGQRKIWGGRADVRNALYMASVAALIWNSKLSAYYRKKIDEGHSHKWAIVPVMRKLLSLLNRIARDKNFEPTPEPESTKKNARVGRPKKVASA